MKTEDTITFGAKFEKNPYVGEDGKEYYRAIPNSGITITFGADMSLHMKKELGRNSKEYRTFVENVLNRDNGKCVICGSSINPEVHHIMPYEKYKELRTNVKNGITICELHHSSLIFGSFHQIYGNRNNTPEQLQEYIDNRRNELGLSRITIDEIINKKV